MKKSDVQGVLEVALRLPVEAQAALAAEQIHSLDATETEEDIDDAWAEEIQRRLAGVDAGAVTPVPWPEAQRRILEKLTPARR
ncbi:MAG TPA: addiction module protein [Polyangiaceae bacterium]|jgi:putative addiction module component (TIGR02574 family)|nr:addiction module protein [Polyangiaceae bacterium]